MARYFGLRSLGKSLRKALPGSDPATFKKRQFVAGFIEGQAKRRAPGLVGSSGTWKVSGATVKSALEELAKGQESSVLRQQQIRPDDVEKIKKALSLQGPTQLKRPNALPSNTTTPKTQLPPRLQNPMK